MLEALNSRACSVHWTQFHGNRGAALRFPTLLATQMEIGAGLLRAAEVGGSVTLERSPGEGLPESVRACARQGFQVRLVAERGEAPARRQGASPLSHPASRCTSPSVCQPCRAIRR